MSLGREDPVAAYIDDLEAALSRSWIARRRIVGEVRAHLEEGVELLQRERDLTRSAAAGEAIARFGSARELALQFNAIPGRRSAAVRRLAVLWVAWLAAMGMGSATVWASLDAPAAAVTSRAPLKIRSPSEHRCGGRGSSRLGIQTVRAGAARCR